MSLAPSALRQNIEAAITAALGPLASPAPVRPCEVSGLAYDKFPGADLRDREACAFAVGLLSTSSLPDRQRRQAGGTPCSSTVGVRWTWWLRPDAHVLDQDAALDAEVRIVAAVSATNGVDQNRPRFVGASRRIDADGALLVGELTFTVTHIYPL